VVFAEGGGGGHRLKDELAFHIKKEGGSQKDRERTKGKVRGTFKNKGGRCKLARPSCNV